MYMYTEYSIPACCIPAWYWYVTLPNDLLHFCSFILLFSGGQDKCKAHVCDCDSKAAMCFARAKYQDKFWNYDQNKCK